MRQMMNAPEPVVCSEEEYALLAAKALERLHKTVEKEGNSRGRKTNLLRQLSRKREIRAANAQNRKALNVEDDYAAAEISDEEYAHLARVAAEQMLTRQERAKMKAQEIVVCSDEEYARLATESLDRMRRDGENEKSPVLRNRSLLKRLSRKSNGVVGTMGKASAFDSDRAAAEISDEEYAHLAHTAAEQLVARQQTGKNKSEDLTVCSDEEYARLTAAALSRVRSDGRVDRNSPGEDIPAPVSEEKYAQLSEEAAEQMEARQAKAERLLSLINSPIAYSVIIVCIVSISWWIGMHRGVDVQNRQRRAHLGTHRSHHQDTLDDTGQ